MIKKINLLRIIIAILLMIILLLLLSKCNQNNYNYKVSTGCIDIFNIDIDEKNNHKDISIYDNNGLYIYQQKLNIFSNPAFKYTNKIAPGSFNTYNFKVKNISNKNIKYYIMMEEITKYKINLKYRLKKNNQYIIGNTSKWIDAKYLNTELSELETNKIDNYSLEWLWVDDDQIDSYIGENMIDEYNLNIKFYTEL